MLDSVDDAPISGDEVADRILASLTASPDASPDAPAPVESEAKPPVEAEPAAPSADAVPEPPADAVAESPAPTDASPAPITPDNPTPDPGTPFSFKVYGKVVDVPGAVKRADGTITLTDDAWKRLIQPNLHDAADVQRRLAEKDTALRRAQETRAERERVAEQVMAKIGALMNEADDEKFADAMFRMRQNFPLLVKDAELAAVKAERDARLAEDRQVAERQAAESEPEAVKSWVDQALDVALARPEYAEDAKDPAFRARAARVLQLGIRQVIPAEGKVDEAAFFRILEAEAQDARERRAILSRAQQYEAAAKANAQQAKAPPPAVPARGTPTGASKTPQFKTKAEYEAYLDQLASSPV